MCGSAPVLNSFQLPCSNHLCFRFPFCRGRRRAWRSSFPSGPLSCPPPPPPFLRPPFVFSRVRPPSALSDGRLKSCVFSRRPQGGAAGGGAPARESLSKTRLAKKKQGYARYRAPSATFSHGHRGRHRGRHRHRGRLGWDSVAPRSGLGLGRTAVGTRTRSHRGRDSDSVAKRSQVGSSPGSTAAGADHMRHEESVLFPARCCTCMSVSMCMCMPCACTCGMNLPGTPHNSNSLSLSGEQGTLRSLSGKISETARCKIDRSGSGEGLSRPIIARQGSSQVGGEGHSRRSF